MNPSYFPYKVNKNKTQHQKYLPKNTSF